MYVVKLLAYGRNEGGMKFQPVLGLVYLSTLEDKIYYKTAFPYVILTPKDAFDFFTLCRKSGIRQGMGSSIKAVLQDYIGSLSTYHARRYTGKLRDILRTVRPKTAVAGSYKDEIFGYIAKGKLTNQEFIDLHTVLGNLHNNIVDQDTLTVIANRRFQLEELKSEFGNLSKESLMKVYDFMIPGLKPQALMQNLETIAWVYSSNKRPTFTERKRGNRTQPDCEYLKPEMIRKVEEKLKDVKAYKRSRMLPFTPLQASKMTSVPEWKEALEWLVEEATKTMFDPEKVAGKKGRFNVDTSGSMKGRKLTNNRPDSDLYAPYLSSNEFVGIMGSALRQAFPDSTIWAIASSYKKIPVRTTRTMKLAQEIMSTDVGYGTNFEQCITGDIHDKDSDYWGYRSRSSATTHSVEAEYHGEDFYIMLTDGEATDNLEAAWARARKPKDAKLIIWHLETSDRKVSNRPDIFYLFGYSDKMVDVVRTIIETGANHVDIIKNYELLPVKAGHEEVETGEE
jgi:60 kDa SS-A/Ro ribonucleoprotein